jgi:hypothetical protein
MESVSRGTPGWAIVVSALITAGGALGALYLRPASEAQFTDLRDQLHAAQRDRDEADKQILALRQQLEGVSLMIDRGPLIYSYAVDWRGRNDAECSSLAVHAMLKAGASESAVDVTTPWAPTTSVGAMRITIVCLPTQKSIVVAGYFRDKLERLRNLLRSSFSPSASSSGL